MTNAKKRVRRRSNWYVYLISFLAAFVVLALFILAFWDNFFPEKQQQTVNRQGAINYIPDSELDVTVLFMMSAAQGAPPEYFMLLNYRPRDEKIVLVPMKAETKITGGTLVDVYKSGGANAVMSGIESTFKIECGYYIKFDRSSFINFVGMFGDVTVNIPYELSDGTTVFNAGLSLLSSVDLYSYITFPSFNSDNGDYRLVVMGSSIVSLINNNIRGFTLEEIQDFFNKILNNADTNLTFNDYTIYQQALLYNSENSVSPSTYYIPFGEYDGAGAFVTSDESVNAIMIKFTAD